MFVSMSHRAERILSQIMVGCLDYEATGKSSKSGALCGAEVAAQISGMSRPVFLAIAIWGGFSKPSDFDELKGFLMRDVIIKSNWFCIKTYLKDLSYQQKVDGLVLGAIAHLQHKESGIKTAILSERMGITRRGFNKTWESRFYPLKDRLQFWLMTAATKLHDGSANGKIHII